MKKSKTSKIDKPIIITIFKELNIHTLQLIAKKGEFKEQPMTVK